MSNNEAAIAAPDADAAVPAHLGPVGHGVWRMCRLWAVVGAGGMLALVAMSVISVVGRKLASAPIAGDVELLQMGAAGASAAFLASAHLGGADVKVDVFTSHWRPSIRLRLDALASVLVALVALTLAWRTGVGAVDLWRSGEVSMVLGWPVWLAQALVVPGLVLWTLAGAVRAQALWRAAAMGRV